MLLLAAKVWEAEAAGQGLFELRERREARAAALEKSPSDKAAFAQLRKEPNRPATFVHNAEGGYTADPKEVDRVLRGVWQKVYDGNVEREY